MKSNLLSCSLAVAATALLASSVGAAPRAHAPSHRHKPATAGPARRPIPGGRFRSRDRAFILNGSVPGSDPNRGDPMAIGRGMHPERMDHMNAATPVPPAQKR